MVRARRFIALPAVVAFFALAASASADTVQVTTNQDTLGGIGTCSLRDAAAIMALPPPRTPVNPAYPGCAPDSAAGTDTITFAPSLSGQTITLGSAGEIVLSDPASEMNVVGPGMGNLTVNESVDDRVLHAQGTNPVTVSGMTITGVGHVVTGPTSALGGCILNEGTLTVSGVRVTGCTVTETGPGSPLSTDAEGAAIGSTGTLTVSDSLVDGNHSIATGTADGGLITARGAINAQGTGALTINNSTITNNDATSTDHHAGTTEAYAGVFTRVGFTISHSTISNNTATGVVDTGNSQTAGGLFVSALTTGTIQLSTIAGNKADPSAGPVGVGVGVAVPAGGIYNQGTTEIRSSTIAQNGPTSQTLPVDGVNLFADIGSTTVSNSLIADPRGGGHNCQITPAASSGGFNDDYSPGGASCFVAPLPTDLTSNPLLAAGLASNGGPTQTLALQPTSPVIDRGSSAGLTDATHDQRGFTRPVDFPGVTNAVGGNGTDIGAFEVQLACQGQATPSTSCSGPSPSPVTPVTPVAPKKKKACKKKGKKASVAKKKCKKKKKH